MYSRVKKAKEAHTHPCLMIGRRTNVIVWFTGPAVGRVVAPGEGDFSIGQKSTSWSSNDFKPFNGSVELSNHKL